ncbi:PREDICTED: uncharacterized protein LOC108776888, partial [Cyphomyrmex costatus]|uniref:uncharacterized protein LOC108776888 n=1 Tax=Cyphomyrmex costatus TaxID=456900 RepID=UPI0008523347
MRVKEVGESIQKDAPSSENSNDFTPYSANTMDEMLIDAVEQRPGLWNQKLPIQKRSPCVRQELWDEVFNNLELITVGVRSGSGAEAGHPQKSPFRFYSRMQFLDEAAQEMPTTSSLPRNICHDEDSASSLNDLEFQQCNFSNVSSPTDCSMSDIET